MSGNQKEAIVIVLDASPSMNIVCGSDKNVDETTARETEKTTTTRFECAKSAILDTISNLIFQGRKSVCAVVVVNTETTNHHLSALAFPNVVEYNAADTLPGLFPPTVAFMQRLDAALQFDKVTVSTKEIRATIWDGIIVAADTFAKTSRQQFVRRLLVFTDAANRFKNPQYLNSVMEGLCRLECKLEVFVVDYLENQPGCLFDAEPTEASEEIYEEDTDDSFSETQTGSESEEQDMISFRIENIKFLRSAASYTGGSVISMISKGQHIRQQSLGKKIPTSRQSKCVLIIAPGLSIPVRYALLTSEAKFPPLKQFAVSIAEDGKSEMDMFGEEVTHNIIRSTSYRDPDRPNIELAPVQLAKAYCYGSSMIPIGDFDVEGLKIRSDASISILKYFSMNKLPNYPNKLPRSHFIGSPFVITDGNLPVMTEVEQEETTTRSSAVISALAQALDEMKNCAICRFVKKTDGDPLTVALFPLILPKNRTNDSSNASPSIDGISAGNKAFPTVGRRQNSNSKYALWFIQIPFVEDLIPLSLPTFTNLSRSLEQVKACDDLIKSLMLPPDSLVSTVIPNPSLRSVYRTVMKRAIYPNHDIVNVRGLLPCCMNSDEKGTDADPMKTPTLILNRAQGSIQKFQENFPVLPRKNESARVDVKGKNQKKRKRWGENQD